MPTGTKICMICYYFNECKLFAQYCLYNLINIIKKINFNKDMDNFESIICDELNEKFLKIKDCLSRCGNNVINILEKEEIKKILFSFLNSQKFIFE